jgi:hypothetical protein
MNTNTFLRHFSIALLITLACSIPVFCGEIHDAASKEGLTCRKLNKKSALGGYRHERQDEQSISGTLRRAFIAAAKN